jgi:hypothetical protein
LSLDGLARRLAEGLRGGGAAAEAAALVAAHEPAPPVPARPALAAEDAA